MRGTRTVPTAARTSNGSDVDEPSYRRATGTLSRQVGDAVLLVAVGRDDMQELSSTGTDVWESLIEPGSARQIAQRIAPRYAVDADEILSDVEAVVRQLLESGHVEDASDA
jgi:hypothetical protein